MKNSQLIIYQTEDDKVKIETRFEDETVWVSQSQMQQLFQKSKATISEHIKNVFDEGELDEKVVVRNFRWWYFCCSGSIWLVATDGQGISF